jgi:dTDP-glucose 4,6-dehydratase
MTQTHCLITGASGFIGSSVLEYLLEHTDWDFTAICSWRHKGSPLRITPNSRLNVVTHDLAGPVPEIGDFDYILNLASESHVDRSIQDPVGFIENNVSSTLQMLEYARKHKPKVFIQFSTDEVFGAMEHEEWDVLLPSNPYAASKAAQEMIAIAYWKTFGIPLVITNSNNIVGKNQDPEKFVPKLVGKLKRNERIEIHVQNGKPGRRHYNPVENVADALLFIIDQVARPTPYERNVYEFPDRYSLPGGEELDNLEMARLVAKKLGIVDMTYKFIDADTVRPGYDQFYPKTEGKLTRLGWVPPLTLEGGLDWIK